MPIQIDPTRDQFGVAVARPDAGSTPATAEQQVALNTRADQICTRGFNAKGNALIAAEDNQQFVSMTLRCQHYDRVQMNPARIDWANLF